MHGYSIKKLGLKNMNDQWREFDKCLIQETGLAGITVHSNSSYVDVSCDLEQN